MSTTTTLACWSKFSELSSSRGSSPSWKHKNSVPRSIFNPTSPTKTSSLLPSLNKSWEQSYSSFQTLARSQCPCVHYHPWCDDCQTLMAWEQPPPIRQTYKRSIPTFEDLKMATWEKSRYQSLFGNPSRTQQAIMKVCSTWREEQFARAITKRSAKMAAWEALRRLAHQQCRGCGAVPPAS